MAITAASRTNIIELNVLAGNGAPGTTGLGALVATYNISGVAGVAASITTSASWTAKFPTFQTPEEFGKEFLEMIVPGLSAAGMAEGITIIAGLLNSGSSQADVLLASSNFLSATSVTDAAFGDYAAKFQNQTAVAIFHTVTEEKASPRALDDITSDAATIVTAKADIDGTTAAAAKVVADAAAKVVADEAAAAAAKVVADEAEAAAAKVVADEAAAAKVVADAAAAEAVLTAASTDAAAASATAEATAVSAAAAIVTADALVVSTAATAALTDATALAATAVTAAATAATDATAETAANTAYDAALAGGVAATVSLANGTKLIAANTAALSAAASATAAAASTTAAAADAAAAAAVTAAATALTTSTAATAASTTAANAAVAAAAATADTSDDAGPAAVIVADNAGSAAATAANAAVTASATANAAAATAAAAISDNATTAASLVAANAAVTAATAATTATAAYTTAAAATAATTDDTAAAALAATAATQATAAAATVTAATAAGLVDRTAQTFTLTTNVDTKTGLAGNDSFVALPTTLTTGDNLNGGAGSDTLSLTVTLAGATAVNGFSTTDVETISVNIIEGAAAAHVLQMNLLNSSPASVNLSGTSTTTAADTLRLDNVDPSTTVSMVGTNDMSVDIRYDAAYLARSNTTLVADTATVNVNGMTRTAAADSNISVGAGIESLTVNATGVKSKIGDLVWGGAALTVTGNVDLDIADTLAVTANTIDASDFSGKLSLVLGNATDKANLASGYDGVDVTVTGGSGNDTLNLAAADTALELLVDGGAGNDTITIGADLTAAATAVAGDVLTGGDGVDTIKTTFALANGMTAAKSVGVTGFESLNISNAITGSVTLANMQAGIASAVLTAGSNGGTLVFPAGANSVFLAAATGANGFTATDTGGGLTDSLSISTTSLAAIDMGNARSWTFTGLETVTIDTTTALVTQTDLATLTMTADTDGTTAGTGVTTLVVKGADTFAATGIITANVLDFTGVAVPAAGNAVNMGVAAVGVSTITGSEGKDVLRGDAKSTIDGRGGNDTIVGGTGNDTLIGGTGKDTITAGTGNDTVTGGADNDSLVFGANLSALDKVDGGEGTDLVSVTDASLITIKAMTLTEANTFNAGFNSVETLVISDNLNQGTFDLGYLSGISTVALMTGITGNETITGVPSAGVISLNGVESTEIYTFGVNGALAGSSESISIVLSASADQDYGKVALADVETINVVATETTVSAANTRAAILDLNLTSTSVLLGASGAAQSVVITGTESLTLGTAVAAATINASGMGARLTTTAGLTMGAGFAKTTGITGQTITGSGGVDTIIGSTGSDTISTGAGNDIISPQSGSDTVDGGAGVDVFTNVGMVATNIEGTGTGQSLGVVVNLNSTAASNVYVDNNNAGFLANGLTSVPAGGVAYLFTNGSTTTDATNVTTLANVESVTLSGNGANLVIGSNSTTAVDRVVPGTGIDTINLNKGNDQVIGMLGNNIIDLGAGNDTITVTTGAQIDTNDVIVGGSGADTISAVNVASATLALDDQTGIETVLITDGTGGHDSAVTLTYTSDDTSAITIDFSALDAGEVMTLTVNDAQIKGTTRIIEGAGDDVIKFGANGVETLQFAASGALSGSNTITTFVAGAGKDILDFSKFLGSALDGTLTEIASGATGNTSVDNKVILLVDGNGGAATDQTGEIAALIQGTGDAMELASGGKAVVIAGYDGDTGDSAFIFLIDDTAGSIAGTISADDVTLVGTLATYDVDTILAANIQAFA